MSLAVVAATGQVQNAHFNGGDGGGPDRVAGRDETGVAVRRANEGGGAVGLSSQMAPNPDLRGREAVLSALVRKIRRSVD